MTIFRLVRPRPTDSSPGSTPLRRALERAWMDGYTQLAGPLPDMALFEIWACIVFIRDMEKKIGMPDFWLRPADFSRLRAHVATLKHRAGLMQEC